MIPAITEVGGTGPDSPKKVFGIDLFCQKKDLQTKRICTVFLQLLPPHSHTFCLEAGLCFH